MRKLSLNIILLIWAFAVFGQENPHGTELKFDCAVCHTTEGWKFVNTGKFNHNSTNFLLEGEHEVTNCAACHTSLVFSDANTSCISCHTDMHNTTVGMDCARCHDSKSWIVSNITELHQMGRFPLLGAHTTADCAACHTSASRLEFEPLGVECIDCHRQDFLATTNPSHVQTGFSTKCIECHKMDAHEWSASGINHDFFPLTLGHAINQCSACHTNNLTEPLSTDCYSCHQNDFLTASNPSHQNSAFSTTCTDCHTTNPDWEPAEFKTHDNLFPIYSGNHRGEWDKCTDCHTQPENYSVFSCTDCHEHGKSETDDDHKGVSGYTYNSTSCYACHPNGDEKSAFSHNLTNFPLKGAHATTECTACHTSSYIGTSTDCTSCHAKNYNQAANPNHINAGISSDCATCHTENGWTPSNFDHTVSTGFELIGGHSGKQCVDCHQGSTSAASSDCFSCHQANYNEAKDHLALGFPTNCLQCHTVNSWEASEFNHNNTNFPLTGSHVATECAACHTNGYAGTPTLCSTCHITHFNEAQNPNHIAAGISNECETCHETTNWTPSKFDHTVSTGFELSGGHSGKQCVDCHQGSTSAATSDCFSCHQANYNEAKDHLALGFPTNCLQCHTVNSWEASEFNHNTTVFPLTGAHTGTDCASCHTQGYAGTTTLCSECHQTDYTSTTNPNHLSIGISGQCNECHTTNPGWTPATFPDHNSYYALNGAHATISNDCYLCHSGNYTTTANTCYACHTSDYNNTSNPNHAASKFSSDCLSCHSESAWIPSTFDHDNQYFPIYSGKHNGEWNSCTDCHTQPDNYSVFSCTNCHEHNQTEMDSEHSSVSGYVYNSANCLACHPTGRDDD
jgi:mRNA-degrading endonuclease YafQ of YafQ-DinJ toxin-antitoxin module